MNSLARFACYRVSHSLRFRQGYRVFPIISSYLIVPQLRIVTGIKMQSRDKANGSDKHEERGDSGKRMTRSEVGQKEKENREFYLHMSLEEKRKLYKCSKKYKILKDILTWDEYYHKYKADLLKKLRKKKTKPQYPVNAEINRKVSIWKGDITTLEIDAIVNAANSSLLGGGGVDGAIHEAAGKKLFEECVTLHGCKTGEAKITGGYKLPAKYVIHTVGPIGEKEMLLTSAYESCLKIMMENKLRTLALPCISTGIYGYDNEKACHVALKVVREFLTANTDSVDRVIFCLFLAKDVDLYEENMQIYFPVETVVTSKLEGSSGSSEEKANTDSKEKSQEVKQKETERSKDKPKVLGSSGSSEEKANTDPTKKSQEVKQKETGRAGKKPKVLGSSGSSEEKANIDPNEKSQEDKQKETGSAGKKPKVLDEEGNSSDVEMKTEPETNSEIETDSDSPEKENIKASESEGKEKTSSDADKEKSTETIKSKTHDKDSLQSKENKKSLKVKDKEEKSKDVEMKEIKSTEKSKLKIKGGSQEKEKFKSSESEGHDMETESIDKSSEDAQAVPGIPNVSKNESGDKETEGKQFGKCNPVQASRM
ncbi:hypothetical protein ACJMK2_036125 [Sinanodonta woodiana]|uniref:Macro domain-containing protein n=1 Tax=Sinanodonta woodiana TaxID=1069815 RepID=A0ABD3WHD7_SINWO